MKRLLTLFAMLALCAGCFALPAAAEDALPTLQFYSEGKLFHSYKIQNTDKTNGYVNFTELLTVLENPERPGYTFRGWSENPNPSEKETPVWSITLDKDGKTTQTSFYAIWVKDAPSSTPTPPPPQQSTEGAAIVAATATTQGGGEMPVIHVGDRFNLVVKVVDHSAAYFKIPASDIAARVNSSIFTFTGTAEVGQLFEEKDPVTNTEYYTYVLIFRDVIYNGGGNEFIADLSYLNSTLAMQQLHFTLGQCEDKDAENARTPNLVVRQSSYGGSSVDAGSEFILSATVYATDGSESLSDVLVSLTMTEGVALSGGSLSVYLGTMAPHTTKDVSFAVKPNASFTGGVATITFNLSGTGADSGTAVSGTSAVSVPINQPDRFEITGTEVSDTIYVGQGGSITVNFVNKGRNPVANLEASISGTNLGADMPRQYFGNLNAGTENSIDFDLYPEQPGPMEGTITLSYEGPDGKVKTLTKDFASTAVEMENFYDPGFVDEGMMPEEQPSAGLPLWGIALIAAAVIAAAVAVVLLVRKRRKAKALADLEAADDEDF